jgi:hypothetical protein
VNITTAGTTFFPRPRGDPGEGIVTNELFSVLVLVALVISIMTAPLLTWYERRVQRNGELPASDVPEIADNVAIG